MLLTRYGARYYVDLNEMPIGRFTKALSGDLSQVSKTPHFSEVKARQVWERLFNQHIAAHGLPESYVAYLTKMEKAVGFYSEAYNGKRWQLVRARIQEAEAIALLVGEGEKIETTCARISKYMGFPVRANECSVVDFYNYVAIMAAD
jgi:hypothetical protein